MPNFRHKPPCWVQWKGMKCRLRAVEKIYKRKTRSSEYMAKIAIVKPSKGTVVVPYRELEDWNE